MPDADPRVLIVDDEAQIRQFLRAGFELGGYHVDEAVNGTEGIREITLHPYDLVILDLSLPDIDGSEVLERIRAWSTVPVRPGIELMHCLETFFPYVLLTVR